MNGTRKSQCPYRIPAFEYCMRYPRVCRKDHYCTKEYPPTTTPSLEEVSGSAPYQGGIGSPHKVASVGIRLHGETRVSRAEDVLQELAYGGWWGIGIQARGQPIQTAWSESRDMPRKSASLSETRRPTVLRDGVDVGCEGITIPPTLCGIPTHG